MSAQHLIISFLVDGVRVRRTYRDGPDASVELPSRAATGRAQTQGFDAPHQDALVSSPCRAPRASHHPQRFTMQVWYSACRDASVFEAILPAPTKQFLREIRPPEVPQEAKLTTGEAAAPRPKGPPRMPGLILLVSDIPDHLPHYEKALMDAGYAVRTTRALPEALARAVADLPVCVVIDERVAQSRGWELCKRLRGDLRVRHVPIVMLTHHMETAREQQSGCNAWLAMPISGPHLAEAVAHVLRAARSAPPDPDDACLHDRRCPSCESAEIRPSVRVGPVQYFFCGPCGFHWRHASESAAGEAGV